MINTDLHTRDIIYWHAFTFTIEIMVGTFESLENRLSHERNLLQRVILNKWLVSISRDTSRAKLNERSTYWDDAIASASGITRREQVTKGVTVRDYDIPIGWHTDYRAKFIKPFAPRYYCSC